MPSDTPLHKAAYAGELDELEIAIEALENDNELDVNVQGAQKRTPLMRACGAKTAEAAKCVEYLISKGADPQMADAVGRTCLHWAAIANNSPVIDVLSNTAGFNINACTQSGTSALHLAAKSGFEEMIHMLIKNGIDQSLQMEGQTAGQMALEAGFPEAAEILGVKKKKGGCTLV